MEFCSKKEECRDKHFLLKFFSKRNLFNLIKNMQKTLYIYIYRKTFLEIFLKMFLEMF